jgi:hypothetical protein
MLICGGLHRRKFLHQRMLPLPVVSALIRLGRKYDFRDVLEVAVERITFENPATLKEYDARRNWEAKKAPYTPTRIDPYRAIEFDILTLARENDILSALPAAYYRALNCGLVSCFFSRHPRFSCPLLIGLPTRWNPQK